MKDFKVAPEVAELEFDRFVELMDLELDESDMDTEDKGEFGKHKKKMIKAIQDGSLVIGVEGEPEYTPKRGDNHLPITFREPTGACLMAMDSRKEGQNVAKMYATMASMTKQNSKRFSNMKNVDLKVCLSIVTLFLA